MYILTSGPHYEGVTTTRVFDSIEKAVKAVNFIELLVEPLKPHDKLPYYWENSSEWANISEKEVE